MKKFKIIFVFCFFLLLFFFSLNQVSADDVGGDTVPVPEPGSPLSALEKVRIIVGPELMPSEDPVLIIVRIINYLLSLIGVVFIIMIIYGGFLWMTGSTSITGEGDSKSKISKGKELLKNAVFGLAIIILSRVIYLFVLERIV